MTNDAKEEITEPVTNTSIVERRQSNNNNNKPPYFMYGLILIFFLWLSNKGVLELVKLLNERNTYSSNLVTVSSELKDLNKVVNIILEKDMLYSKNYKSFNFTDNAKVCATCHLKPNMYLLRSNLPLTGFIKYVRGEERHIGNITMPNFTTTDITDAELENMWLILRHGD